MSDLELSRARDLMAIPAVIRATSYVEDTDDQTLAQQIELTQIPAPPFGETERGARLRELLVESGCRDLGVDTEGNVIGAMGPQGSRPLVVAAHLDTVFPAGTDVTVSRRNDRLEGPGISDDSRGLAALLAVARALHNTGARPAAPLLFVATVGEEGEGNLRGVRHLFGPSGAGHEAVGFVSLDGAGMARIVNRGLGVRRLRAVVRGAGGHSWTDWGVPNPIHALGTAIEEIARVPAPSGPVSTATVARWGGGTSINAIPSEAWIEMDLRSEVAGLLSRSESAVRHALDQAVATINEAADGRPSLSLSVDVIGDRPAGATDPDSPLVQAAVAATRALGVDPQLVVSSTDANVPMALGVPSITLGAGGEAGGAHTLDEWYSNHGGPNGIVRALITILMIAGLDET
jgi:acetylornithine deacetylase/succinyl-diaminopimelate desuccinylase-like protein